MRCKQTALVTMIALFVTLITSTAFAGIQAAERNFSRAMRAEVNGQTDKSLEYWNESAANYEEYFQGQNLSDVHTSKILMAGIAYYQSGKYAQCGTYMAEVRNRGDKGFEAWLFGGLVAARDGNGAVALKIWNDFPSGTGQRYITNAIVQQTNSLQKGETSLAQAVEVIEGANLEQNKYNLRFPGRKYYAMPDEYCSGRFWWRYNFSPCSPGSERAPGF